MFVSARGFGEPTRSSGSNLFSLGESLLLGDDSGLITLADKESVKPVLGVDIFIGLT